MNTEEKEDQITLDILRIFDKKNDVSQRRLASQLGMALGLANSYLKRCVRKGLIKIKQAPANRYIYYLTPKGFAEKSRLTTQYITSSFTFYRQASDSCNRAIQLIAENGNQQIILCGASELAEIASLRATENGIDVVGIYDPDSKNQKFLGRVIWKQLDEIKNDQVCLLTDINNPLGIYEDLVGIVGKDRLVIPDIVSQILGAN